MAYGIWPFANMATRVAYIGVFGEAVNILQVGKEIELIGPFSEKLEQKVFNGIFSFAFF